MVGDISGSFSMLQQSVSRGSWGSRCTSGSETARHTPRHDSRMIAPSGVFCFSNTNQKHGQPGRRCRSTRRAGLEAQVAPFAQRSCDGPSLYSWWQQQRAVQRQPGYTYGAFRSFDVFTETGVPRREPCRPNGRTVSPERELHELSVLPWRLAVASFLVILAAGSGALPDATRLRWWAWMRRRVRARAAAGLVVEGCLRRWA